MAQERPSDPSQGRLPRVHDTVVHMLAEAAAAAPHGEAIVCGADRLTYAEYLAGVAAFAAELIAAGARGGRVATLLPNSIDAAIAIFAVQAAAAQLVPLNPAYTPHELGPILADADPAVVVLDATTAAAAALARDRGVAVIQLGPEMRLARRGRVLSALPQKLPTPDDPSILQYTGGTTGRAKGVSLRHRAVATNVAQREALLPTLPERDRVLAVTPLFHSYAMVMGLYLAAYARGTLVVLPRYRPDWVLETIARERITLLAGSPTIFAGVMAHEAFGATDFAALRLCYSGSSALPAETLRRWEAATGCPICEGYGQTEAGPVLTFNPQDGVRKPGSVGVALPATELQIVDVETGTRIMGPGEQGEIRARGPQLMDGYRNRADETAQALRQGWLYTGDIGVLDEDGYLYIRDRKKDMVIVGGYNVYPREVEEALHRHPDVLEAAVIGRPDAHRGEALVAFVVVRRARAATPEALTAHLAERLVRYKIPAEIRLVEALPKTTIGKVDKVTLRTLA